MHKRGQNIIEYILLVSAVIMVFVLLMKKDGRFNEALTKDINSIVPAINGLTDPSLPGTIKFK